MSGSHLRANQLPATADPADSGSGRIIAIGADRLREALRCLLGAAGRRDDAATDRFLAHAREHNVGLDDLWSLMDGQDRIRHTVLAVRNPGRTAILFASQPTDASDAAALAGLLRVVVASLPQRDVALAQALIEPADTRLKEALTLAGFDVLARLSYMERPLPRRVSVDQFPDDVTLAPFDESQPSVLEGILEASYEGTLDCPGLRGLRRTADILAGHRGTGHFDARLWTIMHVGGVPQGALLLNRAPASDSIELVYIGLGPTARGRGLGRLLLRYGFGLVADENARAVTLAVDDENAPAIALYRNEGFRRVLRRVAMICPLRARDA